MDNEHGPTTLKELAERVLHIASLSPLERAKTLPHLQGWAAAVGAAAREDAIEEWIASFRAEHGHEYGAATALAAELGLGANGNNKITAYRKRGRIRRSMPATTPEGSP